VDVDVVRSKTLTGFVFCLHNHIVCGVQLVFNNDIPVFFSRKIRLWNGVARKITAPSRYRNPVGVIGFVNLGGSIETLGILKRPPSWSLKKPLSRSLLPLRRLISHSHAEVSVWKRLPLPDVKLLEHEGPHIPDWRMCKGRWEIWANGFHEEGAEELGGND